MPTLQPSNSATDEATAALPHDANNTSNTLPTPNASSTTSAIPGPALQPAIQATTSTMQPTTQATTTSAPMQPAIQATTTTAVQPAIQAQARSPATTAINAPKNATTVRRLGPNLGNNWTLVAQVLARTDARSFDNVRGPGQVMELYLIDKNSDTIKAAVFNDAVDKYNHVIQTGQSYAFSNGKIKRVNNTQPAVHELSFDHRSTITQVTDNATDKATNNLPLTAIANLASVSTNQRVSVAGIMTYAENAKQFITSAGKSSMKRRFLLVDSSQGKIVCTLWGYQARADISMHVNKPVLVLGASINDYNGSRSLSTVPGTITLFDPTIPVANQLTDWFDTDPDVTTFPEVSAPV